MRVNIINCHDVDGWGLSWSRLTSWWINKIVSSVVKPIYGVQDCKRINVKPVWFHGCWHRPRRLLYILNAGVSTNPVITFDFVGSYTWCCNLLIVFLFDTIFECMYCWRMKGKIKWYTKRITYNCAIPVRSLRDYILLSLSFIQSVPSKPLKTDWMTEKA